MWPNRYPDLIEHIGDPLRVGPHVIRQGDSQQVLVAGQVQHEARPGGGHDGAVSGHGQSPDGGARPGRRGIDGRLDLRIGGQPTGATGRDEPVRDAVADAARRGSSHPAPVRARMASHSCFLATHSTSAAARVVASASRQEPRAAA